jgi:glycosyltransferase involved in cell wall biosynthesis
MPDIRRSRADGPFTIGYVGRLIEAKGPDVLLRAVAGLPGSWRLCIAGAGPRRARLTSLARQLGLADRVSFDPSVSSTDVPRYLNGLDALVLPSLTRPNWKEQFGRILIEAMACGVPVVGSDSGEIPGVVGEAGLLFPEGDIQALRSQLSRLLDAPALREDLSKRGRARVLAKFTQACIARATYDVYRQTMARPVVHPGARVV